MVQNGALVRPEQRRFPPAQGPTPAANSCCATVGLRCLPFPELWATPTWQALHFSLTEPHYYWYSSTRAVGTGSAAGDRYDLIANGNKDCDDTYSTFLRFATVSSQFTIVGSALQIYNEQE